MLFKVSVLAARVRAPADGGKNDASDIDQSESSLHTASNVLCCAHETVSEWVIYNLVY